MKKGGISVKKNQKVSGPGLYKRILLNAAKYPPTSVKKCATLLHFYFLVYSLLLFGCMANTAKCDQMMPSAKCWR